MDFVMFEGTPASIDQNWKKLREFQPNGPLVNAEFYPGWLSHWQGPLARIPSQPMVNSLRYVDKFLSRGYYII